MMRDVDVLAALAGLDAAGVDAWVEGGWGVDALVGHQTREHDDLDLAVDAARDGLDRAVAALAELGYRATEDDLPIRLVVAAPDGRSVDLHPIRFQVDGSALQAGHDRDRDYLYPADGFAIGRIGDADVACLGVAIEREFHSFYEPRPVDHHDLAQLAPLTLDPPGVVIVSGVPGAGKTTVAAGLAARCRAGVHVEADLLQRMIVAGGRWADAEPRSEAHRQLRVRTQASAAVADVYARAGFTPVVDDIYVTRDRIDLFVANATTRPVRLVMLAPDPETVLFRDAGRPDKTVADRWLQLDAVQREELAGVGLWVDSTGMTPEDTVDRVWAGLDDAVVAAG